MFTGMDLGAFLELRVRYVCGDLMKISGRALRLEVMGPVLLPPVQYYIKIMRKSAELCTTDHIL